MIPRPTYLIATLATLLGLAGEASASVQYLFGVEGLVGRTSAGGSLAGMTVRVGKFTTGFTPSNTNYNQWATNFIPLVGPMNLVADGDTFVTRVAPDSGPWRMANRTILLTAGNQPPGFTQGDSLMIWIANATATGPSTQAVLLSHPSWTYVAPGEGPHPDVTLSLYAQAPDLIVGNFLNDQHTDANGETGIRLVTESLSGTAIPSLSVEIPKGSPVVSGASPPPFVPALVGQTGGSLSITLRNRGTAALGNLSVAVEAQGNSGDFLVNSGTIPTSLAPQAEVSFNVSFRPQGGGPRSARLRINSSDSNNNPFYINLSGTGLLSGSPANTLFSGRQILGSLPTTSVSGSNVGAVLEAGEIDPGGTGGASVWYEWTAPADGWTTVNTAGSDFDTVLALYEGEGSLDAIELLGYNDLGFREEDHGPGSPGVSRLVFLATAGTTYQVAIHGNGGASGEFELHLASEPEPPFLVTSLDFNPNPANIANGGREVAIELDFQTEVQIFPDGFLDIVLISPGSSGSWISDSIEEGDLISGTPTLGTYRTSALIPLDSEVGAWAPLIAGQAGDNFFIWTVSGNDLVQDHYLIPAVAAGYLNVVNTAPAPARTVVGRPRPFTATAIGRKSRAQTLSISNGGGSPLVGLRVAVGGKGRRDFVVVQPARKSLSPGAATTFRVTFRPRSKGPRKATLTVTSNAPTVNVTASGRGLTKKK